MPTYEAHCNACGIEFEFIARMADRDKVPACEVCKSKKTVREFRTAGPVWMDKDFSSENGGRGRFMSQLATPSKDGQSYDQNDPKAFFRSQKDALNECKKRGLTAIKA